MNEFHSTPLQQDLEDVLANCNKDAQVTYRAVIHYDDQGGTVDAYVVNSITDDRDYLNNYAAEIGVEVEVGIGKYAKRIYPNRTQLQVTLTRLTLKEGSTAVDMDRIPESERFTAVLVEDRSAPTQMQGSEVKSEESLDLLGTIPLKFQLFSKAVEKLRVAQCGGIARQVKVAELVKTTISRAAESTQLNDNQKLLGVTMLEASNQETLEQIVIPHGTLVVNLPGIIQQRYGVYNAGLGTFIHNRQWYIYPTYDTSLFAKQTKTVTVYILPKRKFPEIERTYRVKDDSIAILVTSDVDFRGDNDINYVQSGNGARFLDASTVLDGFVDGKGNKGVISRNKTSVEMVANKRADKINYAPVSKRDISSNFCVQYTELAAKRGGLLQLHWINSDPKLILPGQCVRIVYFDQEVMKEAYGVIHRAQHILSKVGSWTMDKHVQATKLNIFTNLKTRDQ